MIDDAKTFALACMEIASECEPDAAVQRIAARVAPLMAELATLRSKCDGYRVAADRYSALALSRGADLGTAESERNTLMADCARLREELARCQSGLTAVSALISDSKGVAGLYANGDVATWEELRTGGRFEDWLIDFDRASNPGEGK